MLAITGAGGTTVNRRLAAGLAATPRAVCTALTVKDPYLASPVTGTAHLPSSPTTACPAASPESSTVAPGVPVPSMRSRAVSAAPSAGPAMAGAGSSDGSTVTSKVLAPEWLKPFTVSAVNRSRPAGEGAVNCHCPAASTGTSTGSCPGTVMRTFDPAATAEAGAAGTCPVMVWPSATPPPSAGSVSRGLLRNR
ncbi:hypothetical protein D9M72_489480 [compost metagenome]